MSATPRTDALEIKHAHFDQCAPIPLGHEVWDDVRILERELSALQSAIDASLRRRK